MDALNPALNTAPGATPTVEREIASDLVRRALIVAPILIVAGAIARGTAGALAVALAVAVVAGNFVFAAAGQVWAVRSGKPALIAVNALGGFVVRMAIVLLALVLCRDRTWIHFGIFALTVAVTHLGLLFWELRAVSATLAFPGLKPRPASLAGRPD